MRTPEDQARILALRVQINSALEELGDLGVYAHLELTDTDQENGLVEVPSA